MTHAHKSHFFHLIWSTKKRSKIISPEIQSQLYPYMGGIIRNLKGSLLEIGGMPEHVHLLISLKNIDNYSSFLRQVKAHSSLWVNKTFTNIPRFEWQQGFGSYTLHFSMIETVRNYIKNQEKHHTTMTYEEEYLKFLNGQNIDYDPRFVFE